MTEDAAEDQYRAALDLADFPASFSVFLNDDVSCHWTNFASYLMAFPVVGSCQAEYLRSQPAQTCRTRTAYGRSHREARNEGCSVGFRIECKSEVRYSSWNVAYLASCIVTFRKYFVRFNFLAVSLGCH